MNIDLNSILTPRVFWGILSLALFFLLLAFGWIVWTAPPAPQAGNFLAAQTVIPAPTGTALFLATATLEAQPLAEGEIGLSGYVQIKGTDGQGLRLRSDAGLSTDQLFLGFDSEVFQVKDGPRFKDGHTWWYLVAIYDDSRAGWAAEDFLGYIPAP